RPYTTLFRSGDEGSTEVPGGTYTVNEVAAVGSLDNYISSISCHKNGNADVSSPGTQIDVTVAVGDVEVCTIKNVRSAKITVKKDLIPASDPGRFDLKVGSTVVKAAAGDKDS